MRKTITIFIISLVAVLAVVQMTQANWFTDLFGERFSGTVLTVPRGGTGATTFTAGQCLVGAGTGAVTTGACGTGGSINQLGQIGDVSTTTPEVFGHMLRYNLSTAKWESVATSTLGITGMTYPGAGIALSTGSAWDTSITNNSANWNTAYTNRIDSATYPLQISSNVISTAFGTTTANTWTALQTFGNASTTLLTVSGTTYLGTGTTTASNGFNISAGCYAIGGTCIGGAAGANTALSNLTATAINTSLISDTDSTDDLGSPTIAWANLYLDKTYISTSMSQTNISIYGFATGQARHQGIYIENNQGYAYLILKGSAENSDDAGQIYFESANYTKAAGNASYINVYQDDMTIFAKDKMYLYAGAGWLIWEYPYGFWPNVDSAITLGSSALYWKETYTDKLYFNSTATLDGNTAGVVSIVGKVGIGTTTPSTALGVNGDVLADNYLQYSKIYQGDALTELTKIKAKTTDNWAEVDHSSLPTGIRKEIPVDLYKDLWDYFDKEIEIKEESTTTPMYKRKADGLEITEKQYNLLPDSEKREHISYIQETMNMSALVQMNTKAILQLNQKMKIAGVFGGQINSEGLVEFKKELKEEIKQELKPEIQQMIDEAIEKKIKGMNFWEKIKLIFN